MSEKFLRQENIPKIKTPEQTANYEGDWTLLLRERLFNPEIKKKQLEKTAFWVGKTMDELSGPNPHSEENIEQFFIWKISQLFIKRHQQMSQMVKYELYDEFVGQVFTNTEYLTAKEYEEKNELEVSDTLKAESKAGMGEPGSLLKDRLFFKDGTPYTNRQKNIIESHEKGHSIRVYTGDQKKEIESVLNKELLGNTQQQEYLANAEEIIERMSQLKNYFGFKGDEKFTKAHLGYARIHYVEDIGLDQGMTLFINAVSDEDRFLHVINTYGV